MIDLIYFSWIRERIGKSSERVETRASTVIELIEELKKRDVRYSEVFSDLASFRVAINQELTNFDASITEAKEIAFFPPMTGG
jgi:molybdopterin synthase sulfur carrier subunit